MKIFQNTAVYVVAYILLMIPTYILPYFGSNSMLMNAFGMALGIGPTPQWWIHVWFIVAIGVLAWARSEYCTKKWLPIFPVLAGFFDMVPFLNGIPLVPTILNVCGIVFGVALLSERSDDLHPNFRKQVKVLWIWSAITIIGIVVKFATLALLGTTYTTRSVLKEPVKEIPAVSVPAPKPSEPVLAPTAPATPSVNTATSSVPPVQNIQGTDNQSKAMLNKANKTLDSLLK